MSSDNFASVEQNKDGKWEVWDRSASTGRGGLEKTFEDKLEAVEWAQKNVYAEYGIHVQAGKSSLPNMIGSIVYVLKGLSAGAVQTRPPLTQSEPINKEKQ